MRFGKTIGSRRRAKAAASISRRNGLKPAIGISFANTFGVFGRPLMKPEVLLELPDWLKALATIQTILGIVLLFLFGLAIRNRFRLR